MFEFGIDEGYEQLQIGWGCPLEAPIQSIGHGFGSELMGYINYFLPLSEMTAILVGYYLASIAMRWIKAIS
jgi:hypothetical protein